MVRCCRQTDLHAILSVSSEWVYMSIEENKLVHPFVTLVLEVDISGNSYGLRFCFDIGISFKIVIVLEVCIKIMEISFLQFWCISSLEKYSRKPQISVTEENVAILIKGMYIPPWDEGWWFLLPVYKIRTYQFVLKRLSALYIAIQSSTCLYLPMNHPLMVNALFTKLRTQYFYILKQLSYNLGFNM